MGETADYIESMYRQGLCNEEGTDFVGDDDGSGEYLEPEQEADLILNRIRATMRLEQSLRRGKTKSKPDWRWPPGLRKKVKAVLVHLLSYGLDDYGLDDDEC